MRADLEVSLGLAVRRYLTNPTKPELVELSSCLEYLLGCRWEESGLTPALGFDGLGHNIISSRPPDGLHVIGLMYEIESQTGDWFSADLQLINGSNSLKSYTLRYGVKGLQPPAADDRREFERLIPRASAWKWKHVFNKRAVSP